MKKLFFIILAFFLTSSGSSGGNNQVTPLYYPLFILSGQSNMHLLDIGYFLPEVENYFGPNHAIVVKDALVGQSITNWYDKYDLLVGDGDGDPVGWFYYVLKHKIFSAIGNKNIRDVFFIWMQGETDGLYPNRYSEVYEENLIGLIKLIESDLRHNLNSEIKFNFVIGRINEFGRKFPNKVAQWDAIREAQVRVAENYPNGTWVNTDDLGTIDNGLHFDDVGYRLLGKRFALAAISLIAP